jgi:hypothetical protein
MKAGKYPCGKNQLPDHPNNKLVSPTPPYPKPRIRVLVMPPGEAETGIEIAQPEKLVFYFSVLEGETRDNTDLWRPVRGIDFVCIPLPPLVR